MFKFYRDSSGTDRREERVTGHDRFCTQKVAVPRYRRRRTTKRPQSEVEAAFELTSITSAIHTIHSPSDGSVSKVTSPSPIPPFPLCGPYPNNINAYQTNSTVNELSTTGSGLQQLHVHSKTGIVVWEGSGSESESVCSFAGFLASIGGIIGCTNGLGRKTSLKYEPSLCSGEMGFSTVASSRDPLTSSLAQGSLRLERADAHRICLKYLESRKGRYVLVDHLPCIGWRGNRVWYLLNDCRVGAERLLSITPLNPRSQPHPLKTLLKACEALQHPYVCPILDLDVLESDNLGKEFAIVVTPVINRGSLRDVFQRCDWTDSWERKWKKSGNGLNEAQVQRLSCQVLEAILEFKSKGLPPGIGLHLHSGNILVQYGTARFSGLDNILFSHEPIKKYFFKHHTTVELGSEEIDAIAFAHVLFSMCSGYEANSSQLTLENWVHVKDHAQACEVLEFVLRNPEGRVPSLAEIGQLDFYRTLDLRELRAPPPSTFAISGPPISVSAIHFLVEYLKENHSNKLKRTKAKSISGILTQGEKNEIMEALWKKSSSTLNVANRRAYSSSTPSIPQTIENETVDQPKESHSRIDLNCNSNTSSIYWTPPNSLS